MGKIKLKKEQEIKAPVRANQVRDYEVLIRPDSLHVRLDWEQQAYEEVPAPTPQDPLATSTIATGDPVVVRTEHFHIDGPEFDEMMGTIVRPVHVGKKFWRIMKRGIRKKVKEMKALEGTIEDD